MRGGVQRNSPVGQNRRGGPVPSPAHGAHPRQQFACLKGFDQIIVRAEIQPPDAFFHRIAGRQNNQRHIVAAGADGPQHIHAVHPGQAQVQQNKFIGLHVNAGKRLSPS